MSYHHSKTRKFAIQQGNYSTGRRIRGVLPWALLGVFLLFQRAFPAIDTVYMEGVVNIVDVIPVGITPFEGETQIAAKTGEGPSKILERDLFMGMRFHTIYQEKLDTKALQKERAFYFIHGKTQNLPDGRIAVECRLSTVKTLDLVLGQTYTVKKSAYRKALHDFADRVLHQLWGEQGSAQTYLTFVSKRKGKKQIMVSDYDGYNAWQVTTHNSINTMPVWHPNAKELFFVSFRSGTSHVYRRNLFTGALTPVFKAKGQAFSPAASPDGTQLLFTVAGGGSSDIYKGNLKTGKAERMTFHWAVETSPGWAPNGKEILFSSDRSGGPQIYVMDQYGADMRRITYMGRYNEGASWSPLGDRIAYVGMEGNEMNIYTCALDGTDVIQLTSGAGNNEHPVWSPDGRMIAFSSTRSGSSQIYIMRADGSGVMQVTKGGSNSLPSWSGFVKKQQAKQTDTQQN